MAVNRLRIGLVAAGGFDESGRERVTPTLLALAERVARDHDLTVYVLRYHERPRTYALAGATVCDLGRPRGILRQYAALSAAIASRPAPPQVLHGYMGFPAGLVTTLVAKRRGIPSIVTMDSGEFVSIERADYGLQRRWKHRRAVSLTARLAGSLTVCTTFQANLARRFGLAPRIIPLGVDTRMFVPRPQTDGPLWRLLHVASLNRVKDQETLLTAVAQLQTRLPDFTLDIVGEDTLNGAIQEMASRLGLGARVTFHGFQPADTLLPLIQRAHVLVMSSLHEAACAAVLEAAACRVPTVGTAVGYVSDWAADGRAVAVPCGDGTALARAVEEILRDTERRHGVAARAQAWAIAHGADWTAREFAALYESAARMRSEPRR